MEILKENSYKGTNILVGNEKRNYINSCIELLISSLSFKEIQIPILQYQEIFKDKVGIENNNLMFNFKDRGSRDICLSPEYTSIIQNLSKTIWKQKRNEGFFYVQQCFRGERQQYGRWREFTQFGVEIINVKPKLFEDYLESIKCLSVRLVNKSGLNLKISDGVKRGLNYYKDGIGWEIRADSGLQLCGGGAYSGSDGFDNIGFAIGVERVLLESKIL